MGDFTIWARISEDRVSFLATISAVALTDRSGTPPPPITGRFESREDASSACSELIDRMRDQLDASGHRVLSVDVDHATIRERS